MTSALSLLQFESFFPQDSKICCGQNFFGRKPIKYVFAIKVLYITFVAKDK